MKEPTKIDFRHRRISQVSDLADMIEMLFPSSRNQRYAAACMLVELKWANGMVPNLTYVEKKYGLSRRMLQRARAKLNRLGVIEHVSHLNSRYLGQCGWRLSSRFETALRQFADRCEKLRDKRASSEEKDRMTLGFLRPSA